MEEWNNWFASRMEVWNGPSRLPYKDVWDRVPHVSDSARPPPPLTPCSALGLIGADRSPLEMFGTTSLTLALNHL